MKEHSEKLVKKSLGILAEEVSKNLMKKANPIIIKSVKLDTPNQVAEVQIVKILNSNNKNLLNNSSKPLYTPAANPIHIIAEPVKLTPFAALSHFCLTYSKQIAIIFFLTFSVILLCRNPEIFKILKNLFSNRDFVPPEKNIILEEEIAEQSVEKTISIETKIIEKNNSKDTENYSPTVSKFFVDQEKNEVATLEFTESLNELRIERKNVKTQLNELSLINAADKIQISETLKKIEFGSREEYELWKKEAVILKERMTSDNQKARVLREKISILKTEKKYIIGEYKKEIREKKLAANIVNPMEEFSKNFTLKVKNDKSPTVNKLVKIFDKKRQNINLQDVTNDINDFRIASHEELHELWVTDIENRLEGSKIVQSLIHDNLSEAERLLIENKGFELKKKIILTEEQNNLLYDDILIIEKAKKNLLKQYQKERKEKD